jgi:outer membrane protein assembly factor BamB
MNRLIPSALSVASRPSRKPAVGPALGIAIIVLLGPAAPGPLWAYTSVRVALNSNILVDGKRVIFAQGTGSLTVLDLETGQVLLRKKPGSRFEYSGTLRLSVHGVLMTSYGKIALLDGSTFEPVWQADRCYDAVSDGEHVISHDGYHSVTCRDVRSGRASWKVDMEGGWHLSAAKGKVLVATPGIWDRRCALLVLDLKGGGQILRHEAAPEVHWRQTYFDGRLIYLAEASSVDRYSLSRESDRVKALDLEGKVVAAANYKSPEVVTDPSADEAVFIWSDKYFGGGRVRPVTPHERKTFAALWKKVAGSRDLLENEPGFFGRRYYSPELLPSGIFANFPGKDADDKIGQLLQMIKPKGTWTAYAPHLKEFGLISHAAEANGKVLVGSTEGHLECLDGETGRPRWLYVFPVVRQTVTYSAPHGMPPYLTQRAAEYRAGVENTGVSCGSIPLPSGFEPSSTRWAKLRAEAKYPGRILIDPSPDDPFGELGGYVNRLAVCAALPVAGGLVLLVARFARRRNQEQAPLETSWEKPPGSRGLVASFLVLSVAPAYGLLAYGRVSHSWTVALKVVFAMTIVVAAFGTIRLCYARRWLAVSVFAGILIGWILLMLGPLRFA